MKENTSQNQWLTIHHLNIKIKNATNCVKDKKMMPTEIENRVRDEFKRFDLRLL